MSTHFIDKTARGFFNQYWPAYLWMIIPVILAGVTFLDLSSGSKFGMVIIYVPLAVLRGLWVGWRPNLDGTQDGCATTALNIIGMVLLWPIHEIYRQVRFLMKARKHWRKGEILIRESSGKAVRSA